MRYELIRYPAHYEVIDHMDHRMPVYETRSLRLARQERDRLNRGDRGRIQQRASEKRDAALMVELAHDQSKGTRPGMVRRAFHRITALQLADALEAQVSS